MDSDRAAPVPNRLLVDSSALCALIAPHNPNHAAALEALGASDGGPNCGHQLPGRLHLSNQISTDAAMASLAEGVGWDHEALWMSILLAQRAEFDAVFGFNPAFTEQGVTLWP